MVYRARVPAAIRYDLLGLLALVLACWLVELPMVSSLVPGSGQVEGWDQAESILLTALTLVVVGPLLVRTARLSSRVRDLEGLLRADPWTRRVHVGGGTSVLVAVLGDQNPAVPWRLAAGDWVQSIVHPELLGRVVAGQAHRTSPGQVREDYEIEVDGGFRFLVEGSRLRVVPLCEGQPMRFVSAGRAEPGPQALAFHCPRCARRSEILL